MSSEDCTSPFNPPVIVSVAQCSDRYREGLPNRVQSVLHHLSLVTDGEPGDAGQQGLKIQTHTHLHTTV